MESPNTETVNGRLGSSGRPGSRLGAARGGAGETAATAETPGGNPISRSPGPVPTGTTRMVAAAAEATVAAASGNNGTWWGAANVGWVVRSATKTGRGHRDRGGAPSREQGVTPVHAVRSPLSARKIGQCHK